MPSLSQGFDDFSGRYPDQTGYHQMQQHRASEYLLGSNGVSPYPELPTPYAAQSVHSQQFEPYQQPASNLPSIREMPDRRERPLGSQGSNSNVLAPSYPNENLGHYPNLTPDTEHTMYAPRRQSFYDPNVRGQTSYPTPNSAPNPSHIPAAADFARYGQPAYDPSSRAYSTLYGDVEYPPQSLSGPQQPNFGVLGDSNDPRAKRRRGNLPKQVTDILRAWFHDHLDHPYPTEEDKQMFMARTGLTMSQVCKMHGLREIVQDV